MGEFLKQMAPYLAANILSLGVVFATAVGIYWFATSRDYLTGENTQPSNLRRKDIALSIAAVLAVCAVLAIGIVQWLAASEN